MLKERLTMDIWVDVAREQIIMTARFIGPKSRKLGLFLRECKYTVELTTFQVTSTVLINIIGGSEIDGLLFLWSRCKR